MTHLFLKLDRLFPFRALFGDVVAEIERYNEWYSTGFDPIVSAEKFLGWRNWRAS